MKGGIIALIVILVLIFVGLPIVIGILFAVGVIKTGKAIEDAGGCFTNSKTQGCGCAAVDTATCEKQGGTHYKTFDECNKQMAKECP
jgi:hypothetical protein